MTDMARANLITSIVVSYETVSGMDWRQRRKKMRAILTSALIVGVVSLCCAIWAFQETTIRATKSPDERYVLAVIERNIDSLPVMPGQGSDVKCFVELRWREDGKIILRKDVDMLQNVGQIQWDADRVWINSHSAISYDGKLIGIW